MPHFLAPMLRPGTEAWRLVDTRGRVVADRLEPAFDSASRKQGLLGRTSLEPGRAIVIAPCSAVHTFFMRFPIDVLFVARGGRVTKVSPAVKPWRIAASLNAFATVELAAGTVERLGLSQSDTLLVESADR